MHRPHIVLFVLLVLLTSACEEEVQEPLDLSADQAYYPLVLNEPAFYDQDSIVLFNTTAGIVYDTSHAEVRETLVEAFTEADGSVSYRGERWQRADAGSPWRFVQTYTVTRTDGAIVRREDNLQFTKLIFPIRQGRSWDGNAAFDERREIVVGGEFLDVFNGWDYRYEDTGLSYELPDGGSTNEALFVRQARVEDNLIDYRIAYEVYAPGVGLLERFLDARHTQCRVCCNVDTEMCIDLPWNEKAEKGFILRQKRK